MWSNPNTSVASTSGFLNDSQDPRRGRSKGAQSVIPVMIGHLTRSYGDLEIWGTLVHIVTFVGIVRKIEQTSTKVTYEIEDETDSITAYQWLRAGNKSQENIKPNAYARVYGHKRECNDRSCVIILDIYPLTDLNELVNHALEVTYSMLKGEQMFITEKERTESVATDDVTMNVDNVSGLTKNQTVVFRAIHEKNDTENGIEKDELKCRIPENILPYLDDIVDFLISEGHIYTTLTDEHFKTT